MEITFNNGLEARMKPAYSPNYGEAPYILLHVGDEAVALSLENVRRYQSLKMTRDEFKEFVRTCQRLLASKPAKLAEAAS
jgi:hypothetical protein